ncbi:MMPL family transporter [Brevibacterium litoralis]|uniref:MMPL family transporter n=1 Tax=Brevibacterium litoralis TaxID=3138935 RepID=UPI0032EC9283
MTAPRLTPLSSVTRWTRVLVPALLILAWTLSAGLGGPLFGRVDEVSSNDRTAYLPDSAEATAVAERLAGFRTSETIPAIVVLGAEDTWDDSTRKVVDDRRNEVDALEVVTGEPSPVIPSEDGRALQVIVPVDPEADPGRAAAEIRDVFATGLPEGAVVHVTGPVGFSADLSAAFSGIDGLLLVVALAAVLIILVAVYRSLLLPAIVLLTSLFALCTALLVVWHLADAGVLLLTGQTQGILFILVIGAATDYSLLYVARFREELTHTASRWVATRRAWRASLEPVLASGGTVAAGLLCLLLSELRSNSALGPIAAIGVGFAVLAALSLLPALLFVTGRAAFWPRIPTPRPTGADGDRLPGGPWARVAGLVSRHTRPVWIVTALVLAVGCLGLTRLDASGVPQSDLVLGASDARAGQELLAAHFPAGSGSPVQVVVDEDEADRAAEVLLDTAGVASLTVAVDSPAGSAPFPGDDLGPAGQEGAPAPLVSDGMVLLEATLSDPADSLAAEATVEEVRTALEGPAPSALVGGESATDLDTNDASERDRTLIVPVVLLVILVFLVLLLRSVVAPVLLVLSTVLSFGTAMGIAALVFTHLLDFPGADPAVPLYGFVFLVALGIDYNIFLMTRVREEALVHGTRQGVLRGLRLTGGIITSAGVVLAATFAALGVVPVLFLAQLAFIVAFGVLLDTFVVRSLLVPALALELERVLWWPSRRIRSTRSTTSPTTP